MAILIDHLNAGWFAKALRHRQVGSRLDGAILSLRHVLPTQEVPWNAVGLASMSGAQTAIMQTVDHNLRIIRKRLLGRRKRIWIDHIIGRTVKISAQSGSERLATWTLPPRGNDVKLHMPALSQLIDALKRGGLPLATLGSRSGQAHILLPVGRLEVLLMNVELDSLRHWERLFKVVRLENDAWAARAIASPSAVFKPDFVHKAHTLVDTLTTPSGKIHVVVPNSAEARARPGAPRAQFRQAFVHLASRDWPDRAAQTGEKALRPFMIEPKKEETSSIFALSLKKGITLANAEMAYAALTEIKTLLDAASEKKARGKHHVQVRPAQKPVGKKRDGIGR